MQKDYFYTLGRDVAKTRAEDQNLILYQPTYNLFTGSIKASLLLQQIYYWHTKMHGRPFYKFKQRCDDPRYNSGDSWTEELGFTVNEFNSAIKRIGVKVVQGSHKQYIYDRTLVLYWTDSSRLTEYTFNLHDFYILAGIAYKYPDLLTNREKPTYLDKSGISTYPGEDKMYLYLSKLRNAAYLLLKNTEINAENISSPASTNSGENDSAIASL
jgi:hypothetical protein